MKKELTLILILGVLLISGCSSRFVTKECMYKQDSWKAMGVLCKKVNDCVTIKENIEKFKDIDSKDIMCSTTSFKKLVNADGGFVNCNTADDCYRVLAIEKPFDESDVVVCEDEFCKSTNGYYGEIVKNIKAPESNEIPLAPVEEETTNTSTSNINTDEGLVVVPTGCGDKICDTDENCVNCVEDCGCSSSIAYCNTTRAECVPIGK